MEFAKFSAVLCSLRLAAVSYLWQPFPLFDSILKCRILLCLQLDQEGLEVQWNRKDLVGRLDLVVLDIQLLKYLAHLQKKFTQQKKIQRGRY